MDNSTPEVIDRLRQTAFGLTITLLPLFLLAGLHFLLAPEIVARGLEMTSDEKAWAVSFHRSILPEIFAYPVALVAFYWLLTGIFGRGAVLRVQTANITLALAIISISVVAIAALVLPPQTPSLAKVCFLLGISQTDWPRGFDTQSSCERFSLIAIGTMWVILPALLLTISAGFRILTSRRHWHADVG